MQYKKFLYWAGLALVASSVLGHFALGPTANASALGNYLYFDTNQSIIHLVLGLASLVASRFNFELVNRYLTAALGIIAITTTAYSFYRATASQPNLFVTNIEVPLESLLYLAFGLWALWVVLMPPGPIFIKEDSK